MVKTPWLAALLMAGCATVEGTVLVLVDASGTADDAAQDAAAPSDAAAEDAQLDASGAPPDASPADASTLGVCRIGSAQDGFGDSFDGTQLDPAHWLVAHGAVSFGGRSAQGGFVRENVAIEGGALVLRVRGDRYAGPVRGIDGTGQPLPSGRRSAAAIATRDLFQSGTYQVQGLVSAPAGVEVALWAMRDDDSQGAIATSTPGLLGGVASAARVWAESRAGQSVASQQLVLDAPFEPGSSHILRFDWYTTATPGVTFWVDDMERWQTDLPPTAGAARMWIVAWAPGDAALDFDTAEVRIQSTFIRPFANSGDRCVASELSGPWLSLP